MKLFIVMRKLVVIGSLMVAGNNAFAACVSGGSGCTTVTGKVSAVIADLFSIYKSTTGVANAFPSSNTSPYLVATIDTNVTGGSISPSATTCNYSGGPATSYRVGAVLTNGTAGSPWTGQEAALSELLTAKTAGNLVVVTIDGATCLIQAVQVQP